MLLADELLPRKSYVDVATRLSNALRRLRKCPQCNRERGYACILGHDPTCLCPFLPLVYAKSFIRRIRSFRTSCNKARHRAEAQLPMNQSNVRVLPFGDGSCTSLRLGEGRPRFIASSASSIRSGIPSWRRSRDREAENRPRRDSLIRARKCKVRRRREDTRRTSDTSEERRVIATRLRLFELACFEESIRKSDRTRDTLGTRFRSATCCNASIRPRAIAFASCTDIREIDLASRRASSSRFQLILIVRSSAPFDPSLDRSSG